MHIVIGLDTGGTFTDCVAYDLTERKVLAASKSPTRGEDLTLGILGALEQIDEKYRKEAKLLSLSTTLATNACVEGKMRPGRLVTIGLDEGTIQKYAAQYGLNPAGVIALDAEKTFAGEVLREPDWEAFRSLAQRELTDCAGVGIVELYSANAAGVLERRAQEILRELGIDSVCGCELTGELNCLTRGASALVNVQLVEVIQRFLAAITASVRKLGLKCPVVIVRSDGTLMNQSFAKRRPVETLLSGPASSVIGAIELTARKDCLVVDMGGTTTDIAIVDGGDPVGSPEGLTVGKWRLYSKGLLIQTFGLGGDSRVFYQNGAANVGSERVMPLCALEAECPAAAFELEELVKRRVRHTLPLYEYLVLRQQEGDFTEAERKICGVLKERPYSLPALAQKLGTEVYALDTKRLEARGVVQRAGLTVTDFMHLRGDFHRYPQAAASHAARFLANSLDTDVARLSESVYRTVEKKLYVAIVKMLLEYENRARKKYRVTPELTELIGQAFDAAYDNRDSFSRCRFSTRAALVGGGAPIHVFLPRVAALLGTECVVPEHAGVCNAVGAAVAGVCAEVSVRIRPIVGETGGFAVAGVTRAEFGKYEEALEYARREAEREARRMARQMGICGEISVSLSEQRSTSEALDAEVYLGSTVIARARGRVATENEGERSV